MWILLKKIKTQKKLTNATIFYYNRVDFSLEVEWMKRTYQPNNRKKAKKLGFFARLKAGIVNRRRAKGRKRVA